MQLQTKVGMVVILLVGRHISHLGTIIRSKWLIERKTSLKAVTKGSLLHQKNIVYILLYIHIYKHHNTSSKNIKHHKKHLCCNILIFPSTPAQCCAAKGLVDHRFAVSAVSSATGTAAVNASVLCAKMDQVIQGVLGLSQKFRAGIYGCSPWKNSRPPWFLGQKSSHSCCPFQIL